MNTLLLVTLLAAQPPPVSRSDMAPQPQAKLSGPRAVAAGDPVVLDPSGSVAPGGLGFGMVSGPSPVSVTTLKSEDGQTVVGHARPTAPGTYVFYTIAFGGSDKASHSVATWSVQVGGPAPPPIDPPVDPPKPPVPGAGFRVLFVYDPTANLTKEQMNVLYSTTVTEYLNRKTAKDEDGRPAWHRWSLNMTEADMVKQPEVWRKIWAATRPLIKEKAAVMVMSDGKGELYSLPKTEQELMSILKKYGGE